MPLKAHRFPDRRREYVGKRVRKDASTPGLLEQRLELPRPKHCEREAAGTIVAWDTPQVRFGRRQAMRNYLVFEVEFEDGDTGSFTLEETKAILTEPAPETEEGEEAEAEAEEAEEAEAEEAAAAAEDGGN